MKKKITKTITVEQRHIDFFNNNSINASKWIRNKVDQAIKHYRYN